jgi:hypothetical protein
MSADTLENALTTLRAAANPDGVSNDHLFKEEAAAVLAEIERLRGIVSKTAFHLRRGDHADPRCVEQIIAAHEKALRTGEPSDQPEGNT